MSESGDDGLRLMVPVRIFADEFTCPICFEPVTDCRMTRCGHNFCEDCITEWIARKHQCPVCNEATTADQLIRNFGFDTLMRKVSEEKEKARKRYFADIAAGGAAAAAAAAGPTGAGVGGGAGGAGTGTAAAAGSASAMRLNAVEALFQKHMARSLASYKDYLEQLTAAVEVRKGRVEAAYADALEAISGKHAALLRRLREDGASLDGAASGDGMPPAPPGLSRTKSEVEASEALVAAQKRRVAELSALQAEFDSAVENLVSTFDSFLASAAPDALLLPVTVTVRVPMRSISFQERIMPTHFVRDLFEMLTSRTAAMGDGVVEVLEGARWGLRSGLAGGAAGASGAAGGAGEGAGARAGAPTGGGTGTEGVSAWFETGRTLYQQCPGGRIPPGAELVLDGSVVLQSDAPAKCFSQTFEKGKGHSVNYYLCKNCRINWVCEACAQLCHKGHDVSLYISNHKPSYACCYCVKRKKCTIVKRK